MRNEIRIIAAAIALAGAAPAYAGTINGSADNQTGDFGYYYTVGGGLFPNGQVRNGDNASGGTIRFFTDDPAWGQPIDTWRKDDWFPVTSSLALTLGNGGGVVFDNNGIETGMVPAGYWDSLASPGSQVVGYSMSNNWDWIYAGYFHLDTDLTVTTITGYFIVSNDANSPAFGFDPGSANVQYHANVFSEVAGQLPANTGSFAGDVFSSDTTAGTFSWSDTGFDRVTTASTSDIYRLTYTLAAPVTFAAGDYYFSHDASLVPLPSAAWMGLGVLAGMGALGWRRRRRMTAPL